MKLLREMMDSMDDRYTTVKVDGHTFSSEHEDDNDRRFVHNTVAAPGRSKAVNFDWIDTVPSVSDKKNIIAFHKANGRFPTRKDNEGQRLTSDAMKRLAIKAGT